MRTDQLGFDAKRTGSCIVCYSINRLKLPLSAVIAAVSTILFSVSLDVLKTFQVGGRDATCRERILSMVL